MDKEEDMSDIFLEQRLWIACAIAREAGSLQKRRFLDRDKVAFQFKGPQDYLTATDGEVEKLVRSRLLSAFPGDTVLGEEDGGQVSDCTWVVDPIDGTSNFARGIPYFCVSIALAAKTQVLAGAIYDPALDELFAGQLGGGAFLNGAPLRVSETPDMSSAAIEVGWNMRSGP